MKIYTYFLSFFLFLFMGCNAQNDNHQGRVIFNQFYADDSSRKFTPMSADGFVKMWFRDSLVVQELTHLSIKSKNNVTTSRDNIIDGYLFIDVKTRSFYLFDTFSEKGNLLKMYTQSDTEYVTGGVAILRYKEMISRRILSAIRDTIVDGTRYKLVSTNYTRKNEDGVMGNYIILGYFLPEKKGSCIQFDRALSEQLGMPMVRNDYYASTSKSWISGQFDHLPGGLSPQEIKIFNAWEKYAKAHPVVK